MAREGQLRVKGNNGSLPVDGPVAVEENDGGGFEPGGGVSPDGLELVRAKPGIQFIEIGLRERQPRTVRLVCSPHESANRGEKVRTPCPNRDPIRGAGDVAP